MGADNGPTQLFADASLQGRALRLTPIGPDFGLREGEVVAKMAAAELEGRASHVEALVLDFTRVDFMNSSGLGACVTMYKHAAGLKKTLILFGVNKEIAEVLHVTRMDKLFKLINDEKKLAKTIG